MAACTPKKNLETEREREYPQAHYFFHTSTHPTHTINAHLLYTPRVDTRHSHAHMHTNTYTPTHTHTKHIHRKWLPPCRNYKGGLCVCVCECLAMRVYYCVSQLRGWLYMMLCFLILYMFCVWCGFVRVGELRGSTRGWGLLCCQYIYLLYAIYSHAAYLARHTTQNTVTQERRYVYVLYTYEYSVRLIHVGGDSQDRIQHGCLHNNFTNCSTRSDRDER